MSHEQARPAEEPAEAEGSTPHPGVTGLQLAPWPRARGAGGWPRAARDISGPPFPASCQASPSRSSWVWAGSHRWSQSVRDEGGGTRRRMSCPRGETEAQGGRRHCQGCSSSTRLPFQANLWGTSAGKRGPADLRMNDLQFGKGFQGWGQGVSGVPELRRLQILREGRVLGFPEPGSLAAGDSGILRAASQHRPAQDGAVRAACATFSRIHTCTCEPAGEIHSSGLFYLPRTSETVPC